MNFVELILLLALTTPEPLQQTPETPPGDDGIPALSAELEKTRGLAFKHPVPSRHLSIDAALAMIAKLVERDTSVAEMNADQQLLAALRLIPPDYDLYHGTLALLSDQVAGFYDPYAKQFLIVDFPDDHPMKATVSAANQTILIHELDHALNDQHFDILKMLGAEKRRDYDDELLARHALAEGDATLAMTLAAMQQLGVEVKPEAVPLDALVEQIAQASVSASPALQESPEIVRASMIEPYRLGLRYVGQAWKRGGWPAVNALWKDPPDSTEQLLHADKRNDAPQRIAASTPPAGFTLVSSIQLGELGMRLLLKTAVAADVAETAAAGWDGDRVELFHKDGARARVRLSSIWDSGTDAVEFASAIAAVCHCKPPAATAEHRLIVEWTP
jgi:hypothetical protein